MLIIHPIFWIVRNPNMPTPIGLVIYFKGDHCITFAFSIVNMYGNFTFLWNISLFNANFGDQSWYIFPVNGCAQNTRRNCTISICHLQKIRRLPHFISFSHRNFYSTIILRICKIDIVNVGIRCFFVIYGLSRYENRKKQKKNN